MKEAACLTWCGYWKRPGGRRGWAHSSALENQVLTGLGLSISASVATSNEVFGS